MGTVAISSNLIGRVSRSGRQVSLTAMGAPISGGGSGSGGGGTTEQYWELDDHNPDDVSPEDYDTTLVEVETKYGIGSDTGKLRLNTKEISDTGTATGMVLLRHPAEEEGAQDGPACFGVGSVEDGVAGVVTVSPTKFAWTGVKRCDCDVATFGVKGLEADGDTLLEGGLTVYKATELAGGLTVDKNTTLDDDLTVGGKGYIRGDFEVGGNITAPLASATRRGVVSISVGGSGNAVVDAQASSGGLTLTKGTISSGITSLVVSGSGNAIVNASATSSTITLTKGTISSGITGISVSGSGNAIVNVSATSSTITFVKGQVGVGAPTLPEAAEARIATLEAKLEAAAKWIKELEDRMDNMVRGL